MIIRKYIVFILCLWISPKIYCQNKAWNLLDCIGYAIANNIELRAKANMLSEQKIDNDETLLNIIPSISLGNTYSLFGGRVLDQTTYEYVNNKTLGYNSMSLDLTIELNKVFDYGLNFKNQKLKMLNSQMEYKAMERNIKLNIIAKYLELCNSYEAILEINNNIKELMRQREVVFGKIRAHIVLNDEVLLINSQICQEESLLLNAKFNQDNVKMDLCNLLNFNDIQSFRIVPIDTLFVKDDMKDQINDLANFPEYLACQSKIGIIENNLKINRLKNIPKFTISCGYSTNYSSDYKLYHYSADGSYTTSGRSFLQQLRDNGAKYLSFSVMIPLNNFFLNKREKQRLNLQLENAKIDIELIKQKEKKELIQAAFDKVLAKKQFDYARLQYDYYENKYKLNENKFEFGKISGDEFLSVRNKFMKAQKEFRVAKYTYIFKNLINEYTIKEKPSIVNKHY